MNSSLLFPDPFTAEDFRQLATQASAMVDEKIEALLTRPKQVPNLHDAARYALGLDSTVPSVRGKRVRPALALLVAIALDGDVELALPFGVAIELLHNFALVHDDIEDGDAYRRGRPAVWNRYGLPHGINVGDYLLSLVYTSLADGYRDHPMLLTPLLDLMTATTDPLFAGQARDINARTMKHFDRAAYEAIVSAKTGSYLAAPLIGGAITADAGSEVLDALGRYGRHVGPLFQIKDDLIDLTEGKGRETIGNDIREGKRSFLYAVFCEMATPQEEAIVTGILNKAREETSEADVAQVVDLFRKRGAFDQAEAECRRLETDARADLASLPRRLREALTAVTEALVIRQS